jgi:hypothetical protein
MSESFIPIEEVWEQLLSRNPERIRKAYSELDPKSQKSVLEHLKKMVIEEGWHPAQRASAQAALQALASQ